MLTVLWPLLMRRDVLLSRGGRKEDTSEYGRIWAARSRGLITTSSVSIRYCGNKTTFTEDVRTRKAT